MSTRTKLSRAQAEAALAAVKAQWAHAITPTDWSGHAHDESLTGGVLEEHLFEVHGYSGASLARKAERMTLVELHAAEHKPERMYSADPVLIEDWNGEGWAISWEEGPDEWAMRVHDGGTSEEERALWASVAEEFGADKVEPKGIEPAKFPADVYAEPYYSFVLCLYPA